MFHLRLVGWRSAARESWEDLSLNDSIMCAKDDQLKSHNRRRFRSIDYIWRQGWSIFSSYALRAANKAEASPWPSTFHPKPSRWNVRLRTIRLLLHRRGKFGWSLIALLIETWNFFSRSLIAETRLHAPAEPNLITKSESKTFIILLLLHSFCLKRRLKIPKNNLINSKTIR